MKLSKGQTNFSMRCEGGSALILALWTLVLIGVVGLAFVDSVNVELAISKYAVSTLQARELARAGVLRARAALRQDTDARDTLEDTWNDDEGLREFELGKGWVSVIGEPEADTDEPRYGLVDEARKLNINTATDEMLLRLPLPEMTEELVDALIDWRDGDDTPRPQGAENDYYESLDPPYHAKNEAFETLEELLLVKGFTREVLYGEDWNLNGMLDRAEDDGEMSDPSDNADGVLDRGLAPFLTVYSEDLNVTSEGVERINIVSASDEELESALGSVLSPEQLQALIAFRQNRQFQRVGMLLDVPGFQEDGFQAFKAVVDLVTVSEEKYVRGLVNVLTAPTEVLAALPGLDEDKALAVVDYRKSVETDYGNSGWLLDVEGITVGDFQQLVPFVTVRSYQFSVDAIGAKGKVFRRVHAVLDRSDPEVRVLYWRDVTSLGPPFAFKKE